MAAFDEALGGLLLATLADDASDTEDSPGQHDEAGVDARMEPASHATQPRREVEALPPRPRSATPSAPAAQAGPPRGRLQLRQQAAAAPARRGGHRRGAFDMADANGEPCCLARQPPACVPGVVPPPFGLTGCKPSSAQHAREHRCSCR